MKKRNETPQVQALELAIVDLLKNILAEDGWTQSGIARTAGLQQPNLSAFMRKSADRPYSWAKIIEALPSLGFNVSILVDVASEPKPTIDVVYKGRLLNKGDRQL